MKHRLFALFMITAAAALFIAAGCEKVQMRPEEAAPQAGAARGGQRAEAPVPAPIPAPEPSGMTGTVATIVVTGANGAVPFSVEIAQTDEERASGLKNRESLAANSGMWFVFPQTGSEKFWMKDTRIPLDIVFVDDNMRVVYIIDNAAPESTELLSSPTPYRYVLEVIGGAAARNGIRVGDSVERRVGPQ